MANRDKQIVTETNAFSEISTVEGLENRLHKEIQRKFQTSESLFYKKLEIINPCDQCSLKDE